ncbi:MAG: MoxR family ATPase [Bacteroidales bacterium]|nr:MoxR family ATPase [Lachnoclostridium sp.]MCM1382988.1 MoxR family ATPase [Lachnoclostridium sp.]MCM1463958.1 MoxR family ATPase [Bacteroidales bacterium]
MIERSEQKNEKIKALVDNVEKVIVGKRDCIELVVASMLAGGHVLIEDVPGVGKTRLVSALASSCNGEFGRVQMTPDVMPTDITGFTMINPVSHENEFRKGATFCNFLLADEINRASPKSQSALLEVMEERQVSIDGVTYELPKPFMVLATQNPVETYGTYHLPEAQMDRFLMKLTLGYPNLEEERDILLRNEKQISSENLGAVITCEEIVEMSEQIPEIYCADGVRDYIINIVEATRATEFIKLGASPRGSIALYRMAKAYAYVEGRTFVIPDDVKKLAPYVLAHRIILTPKGKSLFMDNESAIRKVMENIMVPVEV